MTVLVERYSAVWCQPCKMLKPIFEQLQRDYAGKDVIFQEIDAEAYRDRATAAGIRSVPTVVIYRNGAEVDRITGARSKTDYVNAINRHLIYL
jgi:thioredoxin 1